MYGVFSERGIGREVDEQDEGEGEGERGENAS